MTASPAAEAWSVARYEVARLTGGTKTRILLLILPFLVVLPAAMRTIAAGERRNMGILQDARAMAASVSRVYDVDVARHLFGCPTTLIWMTGFTLFLTPGITFGLTYDSISGDLQSQAVRMSVVRARLGSLVVGKAAAVSFVFCAVILLSHAIVWAVDVGRKHDPAPLVLAWGPWLVGVSWVATVANVALWILISALSAKPKVCMWMGASLLCILSIVHKLARLKAPGWDGLTPGSVDRLLLASEPAIQGRAIGVAVVWCIAGLVGATACLRLRDL